jgi:hypothetical protein
MAGYAGINSRLNARQKGRVTSLLTVFGTWNSYNHNRIAALLHLNFEVVRAAGVEPD